MVGMAISNDTTGGAKPEVADIARRAEAIALMLDALAMLDSMGEHLAASHLSLAIISLGGEPPFPE
ncbi:hypothetical protein [Sphingobium phenoxybenzoativorans]|nr:hypothetical protein [Sphingobium phenoxybenzoativorans]